MRILSAGKSLDNPTGLRVYPSIVAGVVTDLNWSQASIALWPTCHRYNLLVTRRHVRLAQIKCPTGTGKMDMLSVFDFCVAHIPPGYTQDANDLEYAREVALAGKLECLLFTWGSGCSVGIYFDSYAVLLDFRLGQFDGPIAPFFEFLEQFRDYQRKATAESWES
jgi:hypothetical protein